MDDAQTILELLANFGYSSVFLWLFIRETRLHAETREQYRIDLRAIAGVQHNADPLLAPKHNVSQS